MKTNKLISYSADFASFLIQKTKHLENIKSIILFGSASRNEAGKNSDIDIFIDILKENKKIEKEFNEILDSFIKSSKYKNYWNLLGVVNEIKLTIGNLDKWHQLKTSIISNGIVLYGKYKTEIKKGKHETFFIWENVKPNSKRVLFNKQMLGYRQNNKFYEGLIQKYKGEKLGKGVIAVSNEHAQIFLNLFRKYKISVKIKKVLDYSK